jgi:hypothetical protein
MDRTQFFEEYAKHAALNFGQALQGLRYLTSHPDVDARAPRGSVRHALLSLSLRSRRVANDLFFAVIPPHWHHSPEELRAMTPIGIGRWFQYGYCAWRFDDEGNPRADLGRDIDETGDASASRSVDRRWDPRCQSRWAARSGLDLPGS